MRSDSDRSYQRAQCLRSDGGPKDHPKIGEVSPQRWANGFRLDCVFNGFKEAWLRGFGSVVGWSGPVLDDWEGDQFELYMDGDGGKLTAFMSDVPGLGGDVVGGKGMG